MKSGSSLSCIVHSLTIGFFCLTAAAVPTPGDEIDFAHDVVPILRKHCTQCHANGTYKGGLSLDTRSTLLKSGAVQVGQSSESELVERLYAEDPEERMPLEGKKLSEKETDILKRWIDGGLKWETGFTFRKQTWRAPIAPRKPDFPTDGRNPIDHFVDQYFTQHNVPWPKPVDDGTFLRRVSLDLIGLIPTNEQLEALQQDQSETKRAQLIDSLLARKRDYADHWLTFWNDHLRNDYVGTGYIDGGRKQITGWLYRSIYENKPYDQFVRELIAPDGNSEGFIKGIKWRGNVNASQVRELQFAQSVSQVFLGENLKCASCHDSFINDWKLDDAYGLAAIVADKPLQMYRCDKATGQVAKIKFLWPELGGIDPAASREIRLKQTADLVTKRENGRFARTIVNRIWKRMMGRGLVEPVDVMGNRPWSEDVLDYLAIHLLENRFDLKKTMSLIANSRIYQSQTVALQDVAEPDFIFRGPVARRMTAEQFLDAVWQITGGQPAGKKGPIPTIAGQPNQSSRQTTFSNWIWDTKSSSQAKGNATVDFFVEVSLSQVPAQASFVITCDNEFHLMINGQKIKQDTDWTSVEWVQVVRNLKKGKNQFRIVAKNHTDSPNPAALYVSFFLDRRHQPLNWKFKRSGQLIDAIEVEQQGIWNAVTSQILEKEAAAQSTANHKNVSARAAHYISDPLMRSLGRPNREQIVTSRDDQLSTLQALDLSNGQNFANILSQGARRRLDEFKKDPARAIKNVFQLGLARSPKPAEMEILTRIVGENPTEESVSDLIWTLVMLPEFQHVR